MRESEYIIRKMASFPGLASIGPRRAAVMAVLVAMLASACGGRMFGRSYEYEEDIYVSLDGSAEIILNASIPALVMLRGLDLPIDPTARIDQGAVRALYETAQTDVARVSQWRRFGRRFVQVRLRVADIRELSQAAPVPKLIEPPVRVRPLYETGSTLAARSPLLHWKPAAEFFCVSVPSESV